MEKEKHGLKKNIAESYTVDCI